MMNKNTIKIWFSATNSIDPSPPPAISKLSLRLSLNYSKGYISIIKKDSNFACIPSLSALIRQYIVYIISCCLFYIPPPLLPLFCLSLSLPGSKQKFIWIRQWRRENKALLWLWQSGSGDGLNEIKQRDNVPIPNRWSMNGNNSHSADNCQMNGVLLY